MKTWMHPELGEVAELSDKAKPLKAWNHVLKVSEDWAALTGVAHAAAVSLADQAECPSWGRHEGRVLPRGWPTTCFCCLHALHDDVWRSVYGRELMETTKLGNQRRNPKRRMLSTPRGCIIVVQQGCIISVYRPHPPGLNVPFSEQDFIEQADYVLDKNTGARTMTAQQALRRALDHPTPVWHVSLALGHARATGGWTEEECQRVQQRLKRVPAAVKASLVPSAELFDSLEAAQDETDSSELEPVVDGLADWLVVTELLHGNTSARAILEHAAALVTLAPPAWLALQPLVTDRAAEARGVAADWWVELDEMLGALRLAEVPAVHLAEATLAQKVAAEPVWAAMWAPLQALEARAIQATRPTLAARVAELGSDSATGVTATGPLPDGARVFMVDAEHPEGEELTDEWEADEVIWELDHPDVPTWLVTVYGGVPGTTLAAVLEAAAADPNARVEVAPVHRQ